MANLRTAVRHDFVQRMWQRSLGASRRADRRCPSCSGFMHVVPTAGPEVDLCRGCPFVWFDAHELDDLPMRTQDEIRLERYRAEQISARARREERERFAQRMRDRAPTAYFR